MISVYPVDGTLNLTDISCMGENDQCRLRGHDAHHHQTL